MQQNEPSIETMNEVIARFMGHEMDLQNWRLPHQPRVYLYDGYWIPARKLKYHTSWDWLMPVVEKIESLSNLIIKKVWISINDKSCAIYSYFDYQDVLRYNMPEDKFKAKVHDVSKIIATHKAIYQFITWYNDNQQKQNDEAYE